MSQTRLPPQSRKASPPSSAVSASASAGPSVGGTEIFQTQRPSRAPPRGTKGRTSRISVQKARSEEHTSELQSLMRISYAVFCLKKKKLKTKHKQPDNSHT